MGRDMDSRERVFRALNFEEPDRVPVDFWASGGFYRQLEDATGLTREAFLDLHDVDFRYIEGPQYIGPPLNAAGGRPGQVSEEVRRRVEVLAPGGGYILCTAHNVQADCPMENVLALLNAYRRFGRYADAPARE